MSLPIGAGVRVNGQRLGYVVQTPRAEKVRGYVTVQFPGGPRLQVPRESVSYVARTYEIAAAWDAGKRGRP